MKHTMQIDGVEYMTLEDVRSALLTADKALRHAAHGYVHSNREDLVARTTLHKAAREFAVWFDALALKEEERETTHEQRNG